MGIEAHSPGIEKRPAITMFGTTRVRFPGMVQFYCLTLNLHVMDFTDNDLRVRHTAMGTHCGLVKKLYAKGYYATTAGFYTPGGKKIYKGFPRTDSEAAALYANYLNNINSA
jgi:hypothetical protein